MQSGDDDGVGTDGRPHRSLRELCWDDGRGDPTAAAKEAESTKAKRRRRGKGTAPEPAAPAPAPVPAPVSVPRPVKVGPRLHFVNGRLVVDESSLTVPSGHDEDPTAMLDQLEEVDDTAVVATATSFSSRAKGRTWTDDETRLFYRSLRMFGLDFGLLNTRFPGRRRSQIKAKYRRELKAHPALVNAALMCPIELDVVDTKAKIEERREEEKEAEASKRAGVGGQHDKEDEARVLAEAAAEAEAAEAEAALLAGGTGDPASPTAAVAAADSSSSAAPAAVAAPGVSAAALLAGKVAKPAAPAAKTAAAADAQPEDADDDEMDEEEEEDMEDMEEDEGLAAILAGAKASRVGSDEDD